MKVGNWITCFFNIHKKEAARNHLVAKINARGVKSGEPIDVESRCGRSFFFPHKLIITRKKGKRERAWPDCKVCLISEASDKRKKS